MSWIESLILGIVQGITEFLPISSDGHLSITQKFLNWRSGKSQTGEENLFFIVMVHMGTLVAIVVYYRKVAVESVKGLLRSKDVAPGYDRPSVIRTFLLGCLATVPAGIVGLLFKKKIEEAFTSLTAAGVGFLVTAVVLLITTRQKGGDKGPAQTTWLDALLIGIAQAFAPLPGVSRSALTITAALALGLSRTWAVGFSLLMAVLIVGAANAKELLDITPAMLAPSFLGPTLLATVVAGIVGFGAIVWLVRLARAGALWYFSVYLFALGIAVLALARGVSAR
jgi:undecaprenyl-diphosphatase